MREVVAGVSAAARATSASRIGSPLRCSTSSTSSARSSDRIGVDDATEPTPARPPPPRAPPPPRPPPGRPPPTRPPPRLTRHASPRSHQHKVGPRYRPPPTTPPSNNGAACSLVPARLITDQATRRPQGGG